MLPLEGECWHELSIKNQIIEIIGIIITVTHDSSPKICIAKNSISNFSIYVHNIPVNETYREYNESKVDNTNICHSSYTIKFWYLCVRTLILVFTIYSDTHPALIGPEDFPFVFSPICHFTGRST